MADHAAETTVTIPLKELERLIRRAVHEEMTKLVRSQPAIFHIEPKSPLYQDLAEIARAKKRRKMKAHSRREAFGG